MPRKLNDFQFSDLNKEIQIQKKIILKAKEKMKAIFLDYDLTVYAYNYRKRTNNWITEEWDWRFLLPASGNNYRSGKIYPS